MRPAMGCERLSHNFRLGAGNGRSHTAAIFLFQCDKMPPAKIATILDNFAPRPLKHTRSNVRRASKEVFH